MSKNTKLNVQHVQVNQIIPREINANRMDEGKFDFLVKYMNKAGYVQPIIVVDNGDQTFTIVDGEHRWRAAQENGLTDLDVIVVDLSIREQDIMSLNMNLIHGELQPDKFGALLRNLVDGGDEQAAEQLSELIAMDKKELDAWLKVTEEVEESDYATQDVIPEFITFKFKVATNDEEFILDAFDKIRSMYHVKEDDEILYNLCAYFLSREATKDVEGNPDSN